MGGPRFPKRILHIDETHVSSMVLIRASTGDVRLRLNSQVLPRLLHHFVEDPRSHLKNPLGCGSLRYEIASSSGENVLAVSQRINLRAFSPCILAFS